MRVARNRNRHYTSNRMASVRGPQVFGALQLAENQLRQNSKELEAAFQDVDTKMHALVNRRGQEFVALAKHYLPELTAETVSKSFVSVRSKLKPIFNQKQQREAELTDAITLSQQTIDQAQQQTDRVTEQLNEKAQQRDQLQEVVSDQLKQMPQYVELVDSAAIAEQQLSHNEERMMQVDQEAQNKLPSYDNSRLFTYLYKRKFATPDYRSKGLIKRLDRWLARYIDYTKAKRSYNFMKVTPALMREELQRRRANFEKLMDQIEAIECKVEQELGLTKVVEEGELLGLQRDELLTQIEDENLRLLEFRQELDASLQSKGQHYEKALATMKEHLEQTQQDVLEFNAKRTREQTDDRITRDIEQLNEQSEDLRQQLQTIDGQRRSQAKKQTGMHDIVQRFRSANFDAHRSVFPDDFEIGKLIGRYLNGVIDARSFWKSIRNNQKFQENWAQQTSTDILQSPSAQVVMHTMLDLASKALRQSAGRGAYRRGSSRRSRSRGISFPDFGSTPRRRRSSTRKSSSSRRSSPRRRGGGFTTGDGF